MKALPFIEALGKVDHQTLYKVWKLKDFYSQPFDIGMLVNPIEKPETSDDKYRESVPNYRWIFNDDVKKWQEAEDKVLFEKDEFDKVGANTWNDMAEFCGTLDEFIYMFCFNLKNWKQSIVDKYFNQTK